MTATRLAVLLSALGLSACADRVPDALGRASDAGSIAVGSGAALATLPPSAGRIVAVRRTPHANGFTQEVVMEGPPVMAGENRIILQALTTAGGIGRYGSGDELKVEPPTDHDIATEMEARIPGVAMRFAAAGERNRLGLFGYAVGAAGRLTCVYAWQYVSPARPLSLIEGAADRGALPLSLRVRLCRELPAATLVGYLRDLRVMPAAPDGATEAARPSMASPSSADDALAAAVSSASDVARDPPDIRRVVDRSRAIDEPVRPVGPRRVARRIARRPRVLPRPARPRHTSLHVVGFRDARVPGIPRLPTPDDIMASEPVPMRSPATRPSSPQPAAAAADLLPMPR